VTKETATWLSPMLDAALDRGTDILPLMQQATMPVAEAATQFGDWVAKMQAANPDSGVRHSAIDWVWFGGLLRDALGWHAYPAAPW
jgi:hypothetical protein